MKRILLILAICAGISNLYSQVLYPELSGQALIDQLRMDYKPTQVLGYDTARDSMFAIIDNDNDFVTCVYTGYTIYINPAADASTDAYNQDMNTEHSWPQSMGADAGNARSDLHHLYPTRMQVNSSRGNYPFAEITDAITDTWWRLDYSQTTIPGTNIEAYSEKDNSGYFEPREDHKGNVARSMFYFYTMYKEQSDTNFFHLQKETLRFWNLLDAVDQAELDRSQQVAHFQGNKENPFVLDTTLVRRAYFSGSSGQPDTTVVVVPGEIIITEIMQNPAVVADTDGEWFEIYNRSSQAIDINGWYIRDNDTNAHQISNGGPLLIQPNTYAVLGRNSNMLSNGGVSIVYQYDGFDIANGDDEIVLYASDGTTEIDRVEYDGGPLWPDPNGASMYFDAQATEDNNTYTNWSVSQLPWAGSAGDAGSPGYGDIVADISEIKENVASDFNLQNYPNPFNPCTSIRFNLAAVSNVELHIYNNLGQHVEILVQKSMQAGTHIINFNASGLSSGVYYGVLKTDLGSQMHKMMCIK